jgi:hypothetical protein
MTFMNIVSGDSWGIGEWGNDSTSNDPILTGPGIVQYFNLNSGVVSLSRGGCSNQQSVAYLDEFLNKFKPSLQDVFYFIVTDPCRDPGCFDDLSGGIEQAIRTTIDRALNKLNELARTHNIQVNLIGGICDLDTVDTLSYTNLKIAVPSWGKLIDEKYVPSIFWGDGLRTLDQHNLEYLDLKKEWVSIADQCIKKQAMFDTWKLTGLSADRMHPGRRGHLVLRDFLFPDSGHKV